MANLGASKRNRTAGLRFTRAPLYQLSYAGTIKINWKEGKITYQVVIENSTIMKF